MNHPRRGEKFLPQERYRPDFTWRKERDKPFGPSEVTKKEEE